MAPHLQIVDELKDFMECIYAMNKDKKLVFVSIDHTALVQGSGDAKRNIDNLMNMCNIAKRTFPNIFFLIVSQLNREIEVVDVIRKDYMPRQSDFISLTSLGQSYVRPW